MVFYFTGTGNSLYVAKRLEEKPISIPQIIRNETQEFTADVIGIVAPIYGHEMPPMVKEFVQKAVFHADYFYIILTYGNRHGGASELAETFCRECGIAPSYINVLLMVDSWLPGFDMNEQRLMDKKTEENLSEIIADIHDRKRMISKVTDTDREVHQQFLQNMEKLPEDAWKKGRRYIFLKSVKLQRRASSALDPFMADLRILLVTRSLVYWDDTVIMINKARGCLRFYGDEGIALYAAHLHKDMESLDDDNILTLLTPQTTVMHDHNKVNYNEKYSFKNIECDPYPVTLCYRTFSIIYPFVKSVPSAVRGY